MGDRHGGCFARRGRTLNPPRPQVDAHRGVDLRWRATVFRCRGAVDRICPAREGSPRRRPPDTAHERRDLPPRRNAPHGKGFPTRRTSERICPTREGSPRRRPPDTAHERKDLPRAGTRPAAKASRHGARAKEFAPRGSRSPHVPTNGGPPSTDGQPKNTPSAGSHPRGRGRCRVHSPKKNKTTP